MPVSGRLECLPYLYSLSNSQLVLHCLTVSASTPERSAAAVVAGSPRAARGWLLGPWFDLFFIANLAWPLVLLAPLGESFGGHSGLQFWQVYYITTPHRWITLI